MSVLHVIVRTMYKAYTYIFLSQAIMMVLCLSTFYMLQSTGIFGHRKKRIQQSIIWKKPILYCQEDDQDSAINITSSLRRVTNDTNDRKISPVVDQEAKSHHSWSNVRIDTVLTNSSDNVAFMSKGASCM